MQEFYTYNAPAEPSQTETMKKRMRTIAIICICGAILCGILSGVFCFKLESIYTDRANDIEKSIKYAKEGDNENYEYYMNLVQQKNDDADVYYALFVSFLCIALAALIAAIVCVISAAVYNSRMKAESANNQPNYQ